MQKMDREAKVTAARELFLAGFNCAQSVFAAFAPEMGLEEHAALRLASAFGGGMGGTRGICGALSGMNMVLGMLRGYDAPDKETKARLYARVRALMERFEKEYGCTHCKELLLKSGIFAKAEPSERTPEYYRTRPCARYVEYCAGLLADELNGEA